MRDIDSRVCPREAEAVRDWAASPRPWHVLRDHPAHAAHPVFGGLWGAVRGAAARLPGGGMAAALAAAAAAAAAGRAGGLGAGYFEDIHFLPRVVWPVALADGVVQVGMGGGCGCAADGA